MLLPGKIIWSYESSLLVLEQHLTFCYFNLRKIIQLMTRRLSDAFFGDKKFTETHALLAKDGQLDRDQLLNIFHPYSDKIQSIKSESGSVTLADIFVEFLDGVLEEFKGWDFQKFTSAVEISAHVFEHSFQKWLSKEESFRYFSEVTVRHSLFRPPHSVCVFDFAELTHFTQFWLIHFHRYYDQYRQCMASQLNQILTCKTLPRETVKECGLKDSNQADKEEILKLLE